MATCRCGKRTIKVPKGKGATKKAAPAKGGKATVAKAKQVKGKSKVKGGKKASGTPCKCTGN